MPPGAGGGKSEPLSAGLTKKIAKHLNAPPATLSETLKTARKCSFHVRVNSSCQLLPESSDESGEG
jgi:hypothetical protein